MMNDLASVARGGAGLAALLLLPGLLVVRAPWTAVPFLSLFFWIASWWWLPSLGRERLLTGALVAFALAALLRLVRLDASRPSWPALLALAAALLRVGAGQVPAAGLHTRLDPTSTRLMVWHDGLPVTYAPLREAGDFRAHPHGFDAFAADVSLLSGTDVSRSVALAAAAARGLSSIGLYAFLARLFAPGPAAIGTLGASLVVSVVEAAADGGDPASSLGLAFLLATSALLVRGRSRAASIAAGAFVGAAVMTEPSVAGAVLAVGLGVAAVAWRRIPEGEKEGVRRRFVLASAAALVAAAPYFLHVGISLGRARIPF